MGLYFALSSVILSEELCHLVRMSRSSDGSKEDGDVQVRSNPSLLKR